MVSHILLRSWEIYNNRLVPSSCWEFWRCHDFLMTSFFFSIYRESWMRLWFKASAFLKEIIWLTEARARSNLHVPAAWSCRQQWSLPLWCLLETFEQRDQSGSTHSRTRSIRCNPAASQRVCVSPTLTSGKKQFGSAPMPKDDDETLCPSSSMNGKPVVSQLYLGTREGKEAASSKTSVSRKSLGMTK